MFEERQSKTFIKVLKQDGEDVRGRENNSRSNCCERKNKRSALLVEMHLCHQSSSPRHIVHGLHYIWIKHAHRCPHAHNHGNMFKCCVAAKLSLNCKAGLFLVDRIPRLVQ